MSFSIDLSKQSILPMEEAQRRRMSADRKNVSDYAHKLLDELRTTNWINDCTSPEPATLMQGTYVYRGKKIARCGVFDGYFGVLKLLWNEFPNDREKMAGAMRANGMSCVPYLRDAATDFLPSKRPSYELPDGWLVESGIGIERARKLLYAAAISVGLKPGADLIVCVRTVKLETKIL